MQTKNPHPLVTVLMTVYNGSQYLKTAIDSILNQTYPNFEFIIIDDGSSDSTPDIIRSFHDSRMKIIQNTVNLGVSLAKNKGLEIAQGTYIAIADCDDISLPNRLEAQVLFMEKHPEIDACGSWIKNLRESATQICPYPVNPQYIKCLLLFCSGLAHPAAIIRHNTLSSSIRYNSAYKYAHDYDLWLQLAGNSLLTNIPQVLLHYRLHAAQISTRYNKAQWEETFFIQFKHLQTLGIEFSPQEFEIHKAISLFRGSGNPSLIKNRDNFLKAAESWFAKLLNHNRISGYYAHDELQHLLTQVHWQLAQIVERQSDSHDD